MFSKYLITIQLELSRLMEYRINFFLRLIVNTFVPLVIKIYLLTAMFKLTGSEQIAGYDHNDMMIYTLWATIGLLLVEIRTTIENISQDIRLGRITRYLLYPITMFEITTFQYVAAFLLQLLCFAGGAAVLHFGYDGFTVDLSSSSSWLAFTMLLLGSLFWFVIHFTIGLFTFWLDEIWPFFIIFQMFARLLSGNPFPIPMIEKAVPGISEIFFYLPFQWFLYVPAELFTGHLNVHSTINGKPIWYGVFVLAFWCGLTLCANKFFWKTGIKKYSAAGM